MRRLVDFYCKVIASIYKIGNSKDLMMFMDTIKRNLWVVVVCMSYYLLAGCGCNEDAEVQTSISYTLTVSPDLLKFVTPQISYVDENGILVTITGVEELDGKVIENSTELSSSGSYAGSWTSVVITGTGYKCWTLRMKFNRLNFHSYMAVRYLRNDFVEETSGKAYDFHHNINTSVIHNSGTTQYQGTHVSVPVGDYHYGDNIETYLKNLYNNPDIVGYFVDGEGNITSKDDFE